MLWESLLPPSKMNCPSRLITKADGYELTFGDGSQAICLTSGLWNVNFGYGNAFVADRIKDVVYGTHYSTLFRHSHPGAHEVATRMLSKVGWPNGALLFSTSGSALNDMTVKLAMHRSALVGHLRARLVVTLRGSYHGMTINSMQLSGDDLNQAVYGARSPLFVHLPPDDPDAWADFFKARGESVALVLIEPLLGSGAITVAPEVIDVILDARHKYGYLLAADEVAMGFYRLGTLAASSQWPELPDLIGFSKGLTNGTEASSVLLVSEEITQEFISADSLFVHGETQAGSPMATAAILGVLDFIESVNIQDTYRNLYMRVDRDLNELADKYGCVKRGKGLFQYIGLPTSAAGSDLALSMGPDLPDMFRKHGVSVQPSIDGIQVVPAITMPLEVWDEAVRRLDKCLHALSQGSGR